MLELKEETLSFHLNRSSKKYQQFIATLTKNHTIEMLVYVDIVSRLFILEDWEIFGAKRGDCMCYIISTLHQKVYNVEYLQ